jgi:SAM-dependent methyltransferase
LNPPRPSRAAALDQYRRRAGVYDLELALLEPIRRRAVAELAPRAGDVVLDVGCGTGLSLAMLRKAVGPRGRIIGIEQSPEMIERARRRVATHRWTNVTLICSPVETADIPLTADAALFHFTHDILRRPQAIDNVVRHLKPRARVVASGLKWAGVWTWPANLFVLPAALHSVTSLEGLRRPWSELLKRLDTLQVRSTLLGGAYVARGAVGTPLPSRRRVP